MKKPIKKIIICVLLVNFLSFSIAPRLFGQETEVQKAVAYLKTQQADPWITMALASASETGLNLNHLKEVSNNLLATEYERTILGLSAAGKDSRTFGSVDFVAQLKSFYQSSQIGSPDLLNDDFWGILALVSAGENPSEQIMQDSKNFILSKQNPDGGWGYSVSSQSDSNDTAAAVMALTEAGLPAEHQAIAKAIDYLKTCQNEDGGFSYTTGNESDSGSDAWVISTIYKLGQNPANWQKNNLNPIEHLKSLQRTDGSFKWISSEDKGYPVLTAYAVIALSQNYYPVSRLYHLRIEGMDNQVCDAKVKAITAMDIVKNGAEICGYNFLIEQTSWGPYLKKINQDEAHDLVGWLYLVNYETKMVGAADYTLKPGDEILWYFGEWNFLATKLSLTGQKVALGDNLEATVEYFENSSWKALTGAKVYVGSQTFFTTDNGKANLVFNNSGTYRVFAEKSGFIRSNQANVLAGEGISQNVGLKVEIVPLVQPSPPSLQIAFTLDKEQIDFGRLSPGVQAKEQLLITNTGNTAIQLDGTVEGDTLFKENITLNGLGWLKFSTVVGAGAEKNVLVGLIVPSSQISFGIKEGNLTFWAIANQ